MSTDISVMSGNAGGIPAALAGPEDLPDGRDYPHGNSVSQEMSGVKTNRATDGQPRRRRGRDGLCCIHHFQPVWPDGGGVEHRGRSVVIERSASGGVWGRQEQQCGRAGKAVWNQSVVASAPLARDAVEVRPEPIYGEPRIDGARRDARNVGV